MNGPINPTESPYSFTEETPKNTTYIPLYPDTFRPAPATETLSREEKLRCSHIPTWTPFFLEGTESKPCIVIFPGGGYMGRAFHEAEPVAA